VIEIERVDSLLVGGNSGCCTFCICMDVICQSSLEEVQNRSTDVRLVQKRIPMLVDSLSVWVFDSPEYGARV